MSGSGFPGAASANEPASATSRGSFMAYSAEADSGDKGATQRNLGRPVRLWCGLAADEIGGDAPTIIAFPEDVDPEEIDRAEALHPDAIITGAVAECVPEADRVPGLKPVRMRGVIRHRGRNRVCYQKVLCDLRTHGGAPPDRSPVYVCGNVAVGLLICMDLQDADLMMRVVGALQEAEAAIKVLCIPAQMASYWFPAHSPLDQRWLGLHVALSNGSFHGSGRRRNFVTDKALNMIDPLHGTETMSVELEDRF